MDRHSATSRQRSGISQQPSVLRRLATEGAVDAQQLADAIQKASTVHFVGCGSAANAARCGEYLFSRIATRQANCVVGSEFGYLADFLDQRSLVVGLSQSGETIDLLEKRARFIASRFCPLLITLKHDTLSFTFPEVARQMRLLIERQIQKIASEIPPEWNWAELLSAVESNRDFHRLSPTQQDGARSKVRTWTPIHVEALLREFAFNLSGLKTDAFTELTSNSSERCGFQTMARPTNCRRGCVNYRFAQSTIFLRPRQRHG